MKLIFLGAPGAGKGTQAEFVSQKFKIPAISTGNIIREAMKNGTKPGLAAKEYVESGGLVPDEIVIDMLKERIAGADCQNGYILDGFPRNVPQAEALERMGVTIDRVVNIHATDEVIVQRLTGRRVCESCGAGYHLDYKAPKTAGVCDSCDGKLIVRSDDDPAVVKDRLKVYHQQTEPLIGYYAATGKLVTVETQEEVADTTALVFASLEACTQ